MWSVNKKHRKPLILSTPEIFLQDTTLLKHCGNYMVWHKMYYITTHRTNSTCSHSSKLQSPHTNSCLPNSPPVYRSLNIPAPPSLIPRQPSYSTKSENESKGHSYLITSGIVMRRQLTIFFISEEFCNIKYGRRILLNLTTWTHKWMKIKFGDSAGECYLWTAPGYGCNCKRAQACF